MAKKGEQVVFKSCPKMFKKEKIGIKNNTVREVDGSNRFHLLNLFLREPFDLEIVIENNETGESFTRKIKDVSYFNYLYIITWKEKYEMVECIMERENKEDD